MRNLLLLAGIATAVGAVHFAAPAFKATTIHVVRGALTGDPIVTSDGQRLYFIRDSTEVWMYDRRTKSESRVLAMRVNFLAVSRGKDRLAFSRADQDGKEMRVWTVSLDPRTGLTTDQPRRVSLAAGTVPEFSPDGKWIAFSMPTTPNADNLVVVPSAGGPERVIARHQGDVWPIRWTPDGSELYYGLSFNSETPANQNGIYRIPASGGTPTIAAHTADWGTYPGLSPDGKYLMFWDAATWDSVIVQTVEGKRVYARKMAQAENSPDFWFSPTRGMEWRRTTPRIISVRNEAGTTTRLTDTSAEYVNPRWSPDGKRLAMFRQQPSTLIFSNPDGSGQKRIPLSELANHSAGGIVAWSPDGKWLLYRSVGSRPTVSIVNTATGAITKIISDRPQYVWESWRSDSRAVFYATGDTTMPPDSIRTLEIREREIGGADRVVGRIPVFCRPTFCDARFIDDSMMVTWMKGKYSIANSRTGATRMVLDRGAGEFMPVAIVGADQKWVAVRRPGGDGQMNIVELLKVDGSDRRTVTLPFAISEGPHNPRILPGANELIVHVQADGRDVNTLYRLNVATGKPTRLFELGLVDGWQRLPAFLSPDLKSVAFNKALQPFTTFREIDIAGVLPPPSAKK